MEALALLLATTTVSRARAHPTTVYLIATTPWILVTLLHAPMVARASLKCPYSRARVRQDGLVQHVPQPFSHAVPILARTEEPVPAPTLVRTHALVLLDLQDLSVQPKQPRAVRIHARRASNAARPHRDTRASKTVPDIAHLLRTEVCKFNQVRRCSSIADDSRRNILYPHFGGVTSNYLNYFISNFQWFRIYNIDYYFNLWVLYIYTCITSRQV